MDVGDLGGLAKKLNYMADNMHAGLAAGLQKTAVRVMSNAKNRLGHYQDGWAILKDRTVQRKFGKNKSAAARLRKKGGGRILASGSDSDAPLVDHGRLRASITIIVDKTNLRAEIGSPSIEAATQEYGDEERHIPARPYLRPALQVEIKGLPDDLAEGMKSKVFK